MEYKNGLFLVSRVDENRMFRVSNKVRDNLKKQNKIVVDAHKFGDKVILEYIATNEEPAYSQFEVSLKATMLEIPEELYELMGLPSDVIIRKSDADNKIFVGNLKDYNSINETVYKSLEKLI